MNNSRKPNIILMLTDDLGIGDVSCFNPASKIRTECLDRLASQGMRMTDCHSSSAVCSPSRYALLTGRYNWRSRLKASVLPGLSPHLIENDRLTVPQMLKNAGYKTACVGKWHLGMDWATRDGYQLPETYDQVFTMPQPMDGVDYTQPVKNGPTTKGFDYYYGMPASLDQPPFVRMENDRVLFVPDHTIGDHGVTHADPEQFDMVEFGPAEPGFDPINIVPEMDNKVLSLIEEYAAEDQPFFLYYPTLAVHSPLVPAPEFQGKSGIGPYGDFVLQVDHFVGRLMDKLEETGLAENTILIFTSDNGCCTVANIPKLQQMGHYPSYLYRGAKCDIWDGGHRIPYIVRWPGHVPAGSTCDETGCLVDTMATFAEILGLTIPENAGEDSISELPLWLGGTEKVRDYTVHHSVLGNYAIREKKWKLEMCAGSGSFVYPVEGRDTQGMPPIQLYDMEKDVAETTNLCEQYPEVVERMTRVLTQYIQNGRSTPGAPQKNAQYDPWPGLEWMNQ